MAEGSWCERNAPPDAILCADFDTPSTGLTNPPFSIDESDLVNSQGSLVVDERRSRSAPASVLARLEPGGDCYYTPLDRRFDGAPTGLRVSFAFYGADPAFEHHIGSIHWTTDDVACTMIYRLSPTGGVVLEQRLGDTQGHSFGLATSPMEAWHVLEWFVDVELGTAEVAFDGTPVYFPDFGSESITLTPECAGAVEASSMRVMLGAYCEQAPFEASYDDIIITPP